MNASCENTYDQNSQSINSPNYPGVYPNDKYCTWIVTAPIGYRIGWRFSYSIEFCGSSNCNCDSLKLYEGDQSVANLCGESTHSGMTSGQWNSSANKLFLEFNSDFGTTSKGFQITFYIIGMKQASVISVYNIRKSFIY